MADFRIMQANATSLKFPSPESMDKREKVSYEAMELINSLLQEKEHRICSKKYKANDNYKRSAGSKTDKQSRDYHGHYVYPDDASDIKAHPFFHGLGWDRLHLSRPPFVPDIKSCEDTKYFDEEDPVSDVDDKSSCNEPQEMSLESLADHRTQVDGPHWQREEIRAKPKKVGREKKRPRDRVLRDRMVGRRALELRKKGAFLGYAYRRPCLSLAEERGRQAVV